MTRGILPDHQKGSEISFFPIVLRVLMALSSLPLAKGTPAPAAREFWKPTTGLTWDYQLIDAISLTSNPKIDVWDIDLFDSTSTTIDAIHAAGKRVICYFSAGSFEDWRPDVSRFRADDTGGALREWKGENWLKTKSSNVRAIMEARIDLARQKKCDAVEPDNVDAYDNDNGLGLTADDAVDYVSFLAAIAHSRGLAVALKNAGAIVPRVLDQVDFSVQEQCVQFGNCAEFQPFIAQGKPVFHVEYTDGGAQKRSAKEKARRDAKYVGGDGSDEEEETSTDDHRNRNPRAGKKSDSRKGASKNIVVASAGGRVGADAPIKVGSYRPAPSTSAADDTSDSDSYDPSSNTADEDASAVAVGASIPVVGASSICLVSASQTLGFSA